MKTFLLSIAFFSVLVIAGCNSASSSASSGESVAVDAMTEAPSLGIFADENLMVVLVLPGSAADEIDVQPGDVLLDLQLVADFATPIAEATVANIPEAVAQTQGSITSTEEFSAASGSYLIPAVTVEPFMLQPVSFGDREGIWRLLQSAMTIRNVRDEVTGVSNYTAEAGPFKLRVQRGDQVVELLITANNPTWVVAGEPTSTPMPLSVNYY